MMKIMVIWMALVLPGARGPAPLVFYGSGKGGRGEFWPPRVAIQEILKYTVLDVVAFIASEKTNTTILNVWLDHFWPPY